jgi:hypothetical protein
MLWWVKDNAACVESGFLEGPDIVLRRVCCETCSLADGTDCPTSFSREEFKTARKLYRDSIHIPAWNTDGFSQALKQEIITQESSPLHRARFFVSAARTSAKLSVKIANYCTALEALLSTSPNELTYRLSQRVAWLLGKSVEDRHKLFEQVKDAYEFRSKVVHGSYSSEKKLNKDLLPAVRACDTILRAVLLRVTTDKVLCPYILGDSKNVNEFEDRLVRITFGEAL